MSEMGASWKQIIIGKYGEDEWGWHYQEVRNKYGLGYGSYQEGLGDCQQ